MAFPKIDEKKFDLVPFPKDFDKEKVFGCKQYLEVCAKINNVDNSEDNLDKNKKANFKESQSDPNYKLLGYKEMKEEWLKLNNKR
jgi:hypothetical protein